MGHGLVLRPDDLVVLGVRWEGMRLVPGAAGSSDQIEATSTGARLILTLPPQHLAEEPVDWTRWGSIWTRLGGQLPLGSPIAVASGMGTHMDVLFAGDDESAYRIHSPDAASWGPATRIEGATFRPGAPLVAIAFPEIELAYAIDDRGLLCQAHSLVADVWSEWQTVESDLDSAVRFNPGMHLDVNFAAGAQNVFVVGPESVLMHWRPDVGFRPVRQFVFHSQFKAVNVGQGFAVVVSAQEDRLIVFDTWDGQSWSLDVFPAPAGADIDSFTPVEAVANSNFVEVFVVDNAGVLWAMSTSFGNGQWQPATWTNLGHGFPARARVMSTLFVAEPPSPGVARWLAVVDGNGITRVTTYRFSTTVVAAIELGGWEEIGDWFAPGGSVTAISHAFNAELFAVGTDRAVYTTGRRNGQWRSHPTGWVAVGRVTGVSSRLAGPSQLCFNFSPGERITLTADGILASIRSRGLLDASNPSAPTSETSFFEIPWGLLTTVFTPPFESTNANHVALPVRGPDNSVELWHTALTAQQLLPIGMRGDDDAGEGFRPPLNQHHRALILGDERLPFDTRGTVLSALGGRLAAHASLPAFEWEHLAVGGRDVKVRTVERGVLYPFGHPATYVEHTVRRFDPRSGHSIALLHRQGTLFVREPRMTFDRDSRQARQFPFTAVDLVTTAVVHLDPPDWQDDSFFWPRRNGERIAFEVRLWSEGDVAMGRAPLLFVREQAPDAFEVGPPFVPAANEAYVAAAEEGVVRLVGAPVPLAGGKPFEVHQLHLSAVPSSASSTGLLPQIDKARIALPAVRQLTNDAKVHLVEFGSEYLDRGDTDVLFKVIDTANPLSINFAGTATRAGGLVTPSFGADAIGGNGSPVRAAFASAVAPLDPREFFAPGAKLLGIISLREVLAGVADLEPPVMLSDATFPPSVSMTWDVDLGKAGAFRAIDGRTARLHVDVNAVASSSGAPPEVTTKGTLTDFCLDLGGVLVVGFDQLRFTMLPRQKPNLVISGTQFAFAGDLTFLEVLREAAAELVGDAPAAIDVTPTHITATHHVAIPPLSMSVGAFNVSMTDMTFHASVTLPFDGEIAVDIGFGSRKHPFLVGVWILGGGGYLEVTIRSGKLDSVAGAVEVGGLWTLQWGIVNGEVHALLGVEFRRTVESVELIGYLRVGGSVDVLGLVSVSIEIRAEVRTRFEPSFQVVASATIALEVNLFLVSVPVHLDQTVIVYGEGSRVFDVARNVGELSATLDVAAAHDAWIVYRSSFEVTA
jgi:hypothetical protein